LNAIRKAVAAGFSDHQLQTLFKKGDQTAGVPKEHMVG
jgi:hypothetical protein